MFESVTRVINAAKLRKVGIEASEMTVAFHEKLRSELPAVEIVSSDGLVEELREIKEKEEVDEIRDAVRIAEQAFAVIRASLRPDRTEKAIADELEYQIRLFGGRAGSFPSIIGVGPRAALPHGRPTSQVRIWGTAISYSSTGGLAGGSIAAT